MVLSKPLNEYPTATVIALNDNGGYYCRGKRYPLSDKTRVLDEFLRLKNEFGFPPSARQLARFTKVSRWFAGLVIKEYTIFGKIIDPEVIKKEMNFRKNSSKIILTHQDKICLLSLLAENPFRNNSSYREHYINLQEILFQFQQLIVFLKRAVPTKQLSGSLSMFLLINGRQRISCV